MKVVIVFAAILAIAFAAPQHNDRDAVITSYDVDNIGIDGYKVAYGTSNGINAQESAQLKNVGSENEALSVTGQFQYVGTDGQTYTVTYTADENGFQPHGAHLPQ